MHRLSYWIAGTLALLVLAGVLLLHFATRSVQQSIEEALGPEGRAAEINARLTSIELLDVVIDAPKGWPADSSVKAERILIKPDFGYFLADHIHIRRVDVENGYLSVVRPKGGGGLRVLPTVAERVKKSSKQSKGREGGRGVTIDKMVFTDTTIEIFDATAGPDQKVRISAVEGTLEGIETPSLDARTAVDLSGALGKRGAGSITIAGWVNVGARNAELAIRLRSVDLLPFRSYVGRESSADFESGVFHLDLKSRVRNNQVNAQGTLTVESLKLKPSDSPLEALAQLPRRAALGALENEQGQINIPFTISGDLDDPSFNMSGEEKLATAVVKAFGTSFGGIARAFLIMVNGLAGSFRSLVPG